jgi:hypothetical protein
VRDERQPIIKGTSYFIHDRALRTFDQAEAVAYFNRERRNPRRKVTVSTSIYRNPLRVEYTVVSRVLPPKKKEHAGNPHDRRASMAIRDEQKKSKTAARVAKHRAKKKAK